MKTLRTGWRGRALTSALALAVVVAPVVLAASSAAAADIYGWVISGQGKPVGGQQVEVLRVGSDAPVAPPAWTDDRGIYRFRDIPPGQYRLRAPGLAKPRDIIVEPGVNRFDLRQ